MQDNMIAFKCNTCGMINVYNKEKADGQACMACHGMITPIGHAVVYGGKMHQIRFEIKVVENGVDDLLSKLKEAERIHDKLGLSR